MDDGVAITVKSIKKDFILPHEKTSSIKSGVVNIFKSKDKSSETHHALRDISFEVRRGEFFGILGRNGSGKSTLLKILAEIYQPTSGTVSIKGKLVPFIELGVGFNPELTGRENVYLNGALLGFSRQEIDDRYDDIVAFAELEDFMDQKLKNYSSGMQVRLAFSVATRSEADILLVDEVLAVGDADFQRKCYNYFKSLKSSGKTVVFVTHDMGAVKEYCDNAILISNGIITHRGKADLIADEYLKIFNKSGNSEIEDEETGRWGTGLVRVREVTATVDAETVSVALELATSDKGVTDAVAGIKIVDSSGVAVGGSSTLNAKKGAVKVISLKANEKKILKFSFENILGAGTYSIGVTVRSVDGVTVYDNLDSVTSIAVSKEETYYPIVLPSEITLN